MTNRDQLACITTRLKFGDNMKFETKIGKMYLIVRDF